MAEFKHQQMKDMSHETIVRLFETMMAEEDRQKALTRSIKTLISGMSSKKLEEIERYISKMD